VSLSIILTWRMGMVGLCLGILAGRVTQSVCYPRLVRGCLAETPELSARWLVRPLLTMGVLFAIAAYLGQHLLVRHWLGWAAVIPLTAIAALAISLEWGLPAAEQATVRSRLAELARRLGGVEPRSHHP
jgi:hypothetical protein